MLIKTPRLVQRSGAAVPRRFSGERCILERNAVILQAIVFLRWLRFTFV
jgi:hypothetical protein